jgi:hypothetical protein
MCEGEKYIGFNGFVGMKKTDGSKPKTASDIVKASAIVFSLPDFIIFLVKAANTRNRARLAARYAAQDLCGFSSIIARFAESGDRKFFIELGRCLSGEINAEYCDGIDIDIIQLVFANLRIKAKDAVRELHKLGHPCISEENFRMRKKRLRLAQIMRKLPACVFERGSSGVIEFRTKAAEL